jgi:hypothetical protein
VTEADLQAAVTEVCDGLEPPLVWLHIADARRSTAGGPWRDGFPDMLIVGQHRALFRELKAGSELRGRQKAWIAWLAFAGLDAGVWHPADLHSGRIEHELAELHVPLPGQAPDTGQQTWLRDLYRPHIKR